MDTPPVRLRLVFDGRHLLPRAQRKEGLRRCWILLRPELSTVADLSTHLAARFHLSRSCPDGIVLTMDGFALPPFESTYILRDKDIIRVKQKGCKSIVQHNLVHCIHDTEVVEKRPLPTNDTILAIDYQMNCSENQKEEVYGDHQSEEYATANCNLESKDAKSKRKRRNRDAGIPRSSKRKKLKQENPGEHIGCSKEATVHQDQDHDDSKRSKSSTTGCSKEATIHQNQDQDDSKRSNSLTTGIEAQKVTAQAEAVTLEEENSDRCKQTEMNCKDEVADRNNTQSDKTTSRSARRKKHKRQLRRIEKQLKQNEHCQESPSTVDCPSSSNQNGVPCPSSNQNDPQLPFSSHQAEEEESDTSDDIVPVVVRPGYIRFEPAGESNKSLGKEMQVDKEIKGTFEWSGTMSKKKGQKWGINNSNKKTADISNYRRIAGCNTEYVYPVIDSKTEENGIYGICDKNVEESSHNGLGRERTVADEGKCSNTSLDFESFYPLTRLPKEGDLIAYRLVELSSSWCPEISSYRVGRVLIYDLISMRIILLPVPEYPITVEEKEGEESDMLVDLSPYNEDGSLEIEYSSILDVRLVKGNESLPATVSTPVREPGKENGALVRAPVGLDNKNKGKIHSQTEPLVLNNNRDSEAPPEETQKNKGWVESAKAQGDKPDEVQENGWEKWKPNTSTSAWSYRAQRSTAIGPTLAFLRRGKNGKGGNPKPPYRKYGK